MGVLAARCRATVECGQACDRLVKADPPFNLCHIHEKGTDTLPCYFLEPSTEIRSAIFRWLLPEFVSCHSRLRGPDGKKSSYTALLRINKQISREASYVLYEQVPFEVGIHEDKFDMCNRVYDAGGFLRVGQYWPDLCRFYQKDFPKAFSRIRNLRIRLFMNTRICGVEECLRGTSEEDLYILRLRNSVRMFSKAFLMDRGTDPRSKDTLFSLSIYPEDYCNRFWTAEETLAVLALVTEPLRLMGPVHRTIMHDMKFKHDESPGPWIGAFLIDEDHRGVKTEWFISEEKKFQSEWSDMMRIQNNNQNIPHDCPKVWTSRAIAAETKINGIKEFKNILSQKRLTDPHSIFGRTTEIFEGTDRIAYLAQLSYEQYDTRALEMIQNALNHRWTSYHGKLQEDLGHLTDSIANMLNDPEEAISMANNQLVVYVPPEEKPKQEEFGRLWPELEVSEFEWVPGTGSRPVSEDRLRRYYLLDPGVRDNSEPLPYCVLKTPRVVSLLRLCGPGEMVLTILVTSDAWTLGILRPNAPLRSPNVIVRRDIFSFLHHTRYMSDTLTEICSRSTFLGFFTIPATCVEVLLRTAAHLKKKLDCRSWPFHYLGLLGHC